MATWSTEEPIVLRRCDVASATRIQHAPHPDRAANSALHVVVRWLSPRVAGLLVVLLAAKAVLLPWAVHGPIDLVRWFLRLGIVASSDVAFAVVLAVACAALGLAARGPRLQRWWRGLTALVFYAAGLYAVVSVRVFQVTSEMLSVRLLEMAGPPQQFLSSTTAYLSPTACAALAAVVAVLWLAPRLARRVRRPIGRLRRRWHGAAVLGAAAAYVAVAQTYLHAAWHDPHRWERRIAASPHAVFLWSLVDDCFHASPFDLAAAEVDVSDFGPQPTKALAWEAAEGPVPRNVLLIVLESTGAQYLGLYGAPFDTTPQLAAAAADRGVVFENFYVHCPNSCKSLVSLTAGIYPRCDWQLILRDQPLLGVPQLSEVLEQHGYRTLYIHSGFWSWKGRQRYFGRSQRAQLLDAATLPGPMVNSWGVSDRAMYQALLDWIDRAPQEPFFALAFTIETHHPYVEPEQGHDFGVHDAQLARYLNAVRQADAHLGWLLGELRRRGLEDSTLVVITADHGEAFGQHGQWTHGFGVYEPNVRVPLVLLHPSLRGAPRRVAELRQAVDVPPTITRLLRVPGSFLWQGNDLFRDDDRAQRAYFFSLGRNVVLGLRDGPFKYHYYVRTGREELYDLHRDPGEEHNLAAAHPQRCREYRRRVGGFVQHQRQFLARLPDGAAAAR
jgi:arylsulfatase A-like enzyme